ncbi:phage tail tape measure protein [Pseudofrankia asymbiotica]|nr:phage tail tape measure protein [Pseudofrankia asymbiotica]
MDASLIFDLVSTDHTGDGLSKARKTFDAAFAGIAASVGGALGYGIAESLNLGTANAKLAAQLGLGTAEAAQVGKISADIYADNWGDSAETVNAAIKGVYQNIGEGNAGWVKDTAEKATAIGDIFEQDVGGVTASVGQLMKTGLVDNADEAFDVITRGFQSGADKSGDFLDTLNEYSVQWSKFGLDAQTATGLLSQGLQAGARDGDLVADAIKEFSIRAIDGSTTTASGFQAIGLDAKKMAADIAAGGPTASAALDLTLDKLRAMKDPVAQSAAATALFGTQAEDLGAALFALDPSSAVDALGQVGGAADAAMTAMSASPAARLETAKREIQQKLTQIGGVVVGWATQHTDVVKPLAVALGAVAAVIVAVKTATALLTVVEQARLVATKIGTAAQWAMNTAMSANPIGLLVIGIAAVIAILVILWFKVDGFREAMITAFHASADAVMWFLRGAEMVFGKIGTFFTNLPGWILSVFSMAGSLLYDVGSKIIEGLWTGIQFYFKIVEFFYVGLPLKILGYFLGAASWLLGAGKDVLSGLWSGVSGGWTAGVGFLTGLPGKILGYLPNPAALLYDAGKKIIQGLWDGMRHVWSSLTGWVSGLGGWISSHKGPVQVDAQLLVPAGDAIIGGLLGGMQDRWLEVQHFVSAAAPSISAGVGSSVQAAPMAVRAVGGDGASMPPINVTFTGPIYADRAGVERFVQQALPAIQRGMRQYSLSNGGASNITV